MPFDIAEIKLELPLTENKLIDKFTHRCHSDYFFDIQMNHYVLPERNLIETTH